MPPLQLDKPTTISFPPYVTSLDVSWEEPTGWTSIVQTTTLTISPVTTDEIEVWAYEVTDASTVTGSEVWSTFYVIPSIRPPPFTITNDPNPFDEEGVTHPSVTRTITPPPYPYTYTPPGGGPPETSTTSNEPTDIEERFPIVTYRPDDPGPLCNKDCGRPCFFFCDRPCILDCPDGGNDFPDPFNPKPPPRPSPPDPSDPPLPPNPTHIPPPEDPDMDDPQNEEQEDDDEACALEFDLPVPTYRPPTTTSIALPPPPPTESPEPDPEPPGPNPDTEKVHCFDSGAIVTRAMCIDALEAFCDYWEGTTLDATKPGTRRTLDNGNGFGAHCLDDFGLDDWCFAEIWIRVTVKNGCKFKMGGSGANQECGRIIRRIIDECGKTSTEFKQGGIVESNCATWFFDPNVNW